MISILVSLLTVSSVWAADKTAPDKNPWIVGRWTGGCIPTMANDVEMSWIRSYDFKKDGTGKSSIKYFKDLHCKKATKTHNVDVTYTATPVPKEADQLMVEIHYKETTPNEAVHGRSVYQKFGQGLGNRMAIVTLYRFDRIGSDGKPTPNKDNPLGMPGGIAGNYVFYYTRD